MLERNKWICLSVHWDNYTTPAGNNSSVYCNHKKLANFESKRMTCSTQMTFGDLNPNGVTTLDGDIAFFALYRSSKGEKASMQKKLPIRRLDFLNGPMGRGDDF